MESTTTVGTRRPRHSVKLSANSSESSLFPLAVGPQTTTQFGVWTSELGTGSINARSRIPISQLPIPNSCVKHVRSCRFDGGRDAGAGCGVGFDVDGVAAPGLADGLAVFRGAVADEDLLQVPHLALVPPESVLLDPPQYFQEAALHDRIGHNAGQIGGLGAAPGRELEYVGRVELAVLDQLQRLLVIFFRLTGVPDYDVRAQRALRRRLPEHRDLAPVPL